MNFVFLQSREYYIFEKEFTLENIYVFIIKLDMSPCRLYIVYNYVFSIVLSTKQVCNEAKQPRGVWFRHNVICILWSLLQHMYYDTCLSDWFHKNIYPWTVFSKPEKYCLPFGLASLIKVSDRKRNCRTKPQNAKTIL